MKIYKLQTVSLRSDAVAVVFSSIYFHDAWPGIEMGSGDILRFFLPNNRWLVPDLHLTSSCINVTAEVVSCSTTLVGFTATIASASDLPSCGGGGREIDCLWLMPSYSLRSYWLVWVPLKDNSFDISAKANNMILLYYACSTYFISKRDHFCLSNGHVRSLFLPTFTQNWVTSSWFHFYPLLLSF